MKMNFEPFNKEYTEVIEALRDLVYRNEILLKYVKDGRLEIRWTAKDKIAPPGELANSQSLEISLKHAKRFIPNPIPIPDISSGLE